MVDRLAGLGIVVTGAGQGIGRAIAQGLAREGAYVGLADRDQEALQATLALIEADGGRALPLVVDVSERREVSRALDAFVSDVGRLDVVFNNAGVNKPMPFLEVTEENWNMIMRVNALGTLIGIQEAAKRMIPSRRGKIINTSSIAGRQGYPSFAPYSASKFAVNALTQAAARALAPYGITCNAFAPGAVDTPLWKQLDTDFVEIGESEQPGTALKNFAGGSLLGRPVQPEELVGIATFLASSESDCVTGQVFMVDGGMVLV
ncbi:MAG: SDR family oxidoreductase [Acidothermus sp.]|nr:SDR family oxidoreductase [Acidothermus sp.]MCL6537762.1 SDR family oxidoreductase [Acidothermus sp.]